MKSIMKFNRNTVFGALTLFLRKHYLGFMYVHSTNIMTVFETANKFLQWVIFHQTPKLIRKFVSQFLLLEF